MDFELQYLLKKINCINHPVWHDKKDAVIWILLNFINNNLNEELIYKPISLLKVKIKYIKKYMHCTKDIVYIEELLDKYETEKIKCELELIKEKKYGSKYIKIYKK